MRAVSNLVDRLGGAENLLKNAPRDHLSPSRFVLEQFAVRDVFGCLSTGMAPSFLEDAFTPWFFEAESWSQEDKEWETVDRGFGMISVRLIAD